jgi:hypothetical protein
MRTVDLSPYYVTSSVCTINRDPLPNLTFIPPSSRPVQGKRPEVAAEYLAPSTQERRQWAFSHQNSRITPHNLALLSSHSRAFLLSHLRISILHGLGPYPALYSQNPLYAFTDHRPSYRIYRPDVPLYNTATSSLIPELTLNILLCRPACMRGAISSHHQNSL